ncbi:MAG TPA: 50S ribosomal protein L11 methyltransferase [Pyrinomonadaceae bacterium]|nr:50S ribosomal protein L11 methyltransferase [Pyrinomonadaceae bacterium]
MHWYAVDLISTPEASEAVEYALTEAGALGTESHAGASPEGRVVFGDFVRVTGYFDGPPRVERLRESLQEALRVYGLDSSAVREMRPREVEERDWLAEWKKGWRPVEVGRRFVVAPPWSELDDDDAGRLVIRIEPGMAFGTGTHETTRLCLVAVEELFDGESFLDVGTGTGVLAIAAAMLRPEACVEACDTDPAAVTIAHENAVRNGVAERVNLRVGSVGGDDDASRADFVCANLTADAIIPLLPALLRAARRRLVLSGILATQTDAVIARLRELRASAAPALKTEGEWAAIIV